MAGTASAPTAPSPHYGAAGCPPTGPADDTPGGRAARAAGCLLLAAGLALYAGHEAQLFAPPAAAAPAVLAPVATAASMALAGMTAAAEGGNHVPAAGPHTGTPQITRLNSGRQVAKAMLVTLFWLPALAVGAFSIWSRLRAARRSHALSLLAAAAEDAAAGDQASDAPESPLTKEGDELKDGEDLLLGAVDPKVAPLLSEETKRLMRQFLEKETEVRLLQQLQAQTLEEASQRLAAEAEQQASEEEVRAIQAEVQRKYEDVQRLQAEATLGEADAERLKAQLQQVDRLLVAVGEGEEGDAKPDRRVALGALGGIVALQILHAVLAPAPPPPPSEEAGSPDPVR